MKQAEAPNVQNFLEDQIVEVLAQSSIGDSHDGSASCEECERVATNLLEGVRRWWEIVNHG